MNQTFSLTRFGRLTRTYFTDNRGQLLANMGLLFGGLVVLAVLVYRQYPRAVDGDRYVFFFFIGWSAWYVFIMQQTATLNNKERAISYMMQPASHVEKIGLIWLISGLCFMVVYLTVFTAIDLVGIWYVNHRQWTPEQITQIRWQGGKFSLKPFYDESTLKHIAVKWWVFTALLHGVSMTFSLLVRRYTMSLSVVIAFVILVLGLLINKFTLHALTGNTTIEAMFPFMDASVETPSKGGHRKLELSQPIGNQLRYLVGIIVVVLLYITAFFRLKEREV